MTNTDERQLVINYIGKAHTPYQEKFAIPRQPGLVTAAQGYISLFDNVNSRQMLQGIEQYSHLWLIFAFNATQSQGWKPMVRPPRLGGNKKMGVLATRSTFRPNPVGMSVVKFEGLSENAGNLRINISAMDLLNGTPIIDIKPYIPYSDAILEANSEFAQTRDETIKVTFSMLAQAQLEDIQQSAPVLKQLITQIVEQDPRPAYKKQTMDSKEYGVHLDNFNICWQMLSLDTAVITSISMK